jgi:outer membrane protein OmpA-like peptidoglycan-associated protein
MSSAARLSDLVISTAFVVCAFFIAGCATEVANETVDVQQFKIKQKTGEMAFNLCTNCISHTQKFLALEPQVEAASKSSPLVIANGPTDAQIAEVKKKAPPITAKDPLFDTNILFDWDSDSLNDQSKLVLHQVAWIAQAQKLRVQVTGSADSTGRSNYNMGLAMRRAQAAAKHLEYLGLGAAQIELFFEPELYVADNTTEVGRALNRRARIKLVASAS